MNLNDLLLKIGIDPKYVLVLRHRPREPRLNKVLPWLASEKPDLFNAYQQIQGEKLERRMQDMVGTGYIASFVGQEAARALFIGIYSIKKSKVLTYDEYWRVPANIALMDLGMEGIPPERSSILWFDLEQTEYCAPWKGKLIIGWPPPERSWWRRAHRNEFPIHAILEESALESNMPEWNEIVLTWDELQVLPKRWKSALSQWRGIYYLFDASAGKGYVGSAYGEGNLLGRWLNYAVSGHGGNKLLKGLESQNLHFTILQRVSPDMPAENVIQLENSWKQRLHTREPHGLNDN